jgi:hypothetical protein
MDRVKYVSFSLTIDGWNDTISPAWYAAARSRPYHIADITQRSQTPPSSSGPGRSPLKAQTGVRVPLGASVFQEPPTDNVERFLSMLKFDSKGKVNALDSYVDLETNTTGI